MTPFNPDSWMDFVLLIFISLTSLAGVVLPVWLVNRTRKHGSEIGEIKEQVCNTHDTNLRDDLDEIRDLFLEGLSEIRRDIGGLREELRTERVERIEGDRLRILRGGMQ